MFKIWCEYTCSSSSIDQTKGTLEHGGELMVTRAHGSVFWGVAATKEELVDAAMVARGEKEIKMALQKEASLYRRSKRKKSISD